MKFGFLLFFCFSGLSSTLFMKAQFGLIFNSDSMNKEVKDISVCGEKFDLIEKGNKQFSKLKLDNEIVYVNKALLSELEPECLNEKNKLFFSNLNLTSEEIQYWAKLNEKITNY